MENRELTNEEAEALTKDLNELLERHNCEIGVLSKIQLLKRVDKEEIKNPFMPNGDNNDTTQETPKTD